MKNKILRIERGIRFNYIQVEQLCQSTSKQWIYINSSKEYEETMKGYQHGKWHVLLQ